MQWFVVKDHTLIAERSDDLSCYAPSSWGSTGHFAYSDGNGNFNSNVWYDGQDSAESTKAHEIKTNLKGLDTSTQEMVFKK
ncbi:MAG: hypothetical protein HQL32_17130 [Planctomycetes bacterium]|nr:hypothetical protein [Planctomycetota bacterium]